MAGGQLTGYRMGDRFPHGHISAWPSGRYHKAHFHGPGAILLGLDGEGYVLVWPSELGPRPYQDGHEERAHAGGPAALQDGVLVGDGDDAADAAADHDGYAVGVFALHLEAGMVQRFERCDGCELGEAVEAARLFLSEQPGRLEPFDFGGYARGKTFCVER